MKGQKNRNHSSKRCVSPRKFSRLFDANLDKAGFAYVTKNYDVYRSLRAVKLGDIIYAEFANSSDSPKGVSGLNTYCVRYKVEPNYAEDHVAFSPFPIYVF